ncbi:MAG TPA: nucleotidyltransferase domain-containing protein [Acidimicrobiales bacterium]|nr:nucleotidyltransferase domain-containing protein [Acidimicrobiales bacterium]
MHVRDLPAALLASVVASCRTRVPAARGILVGGSYARGSASTASDLDLAVFIDDEDEDAALHYRTWLEVRADSPPLHVSARTDLTLATWAEEAEEPADWAFGLPTAQRFEWLSEPDEELRRALGAQPVLRTHAGEPEVEDMVTELTKVHRAEASADDIGVRFHARRAVDFAAPTVVALNAPPPCVDTPRAALDTICAGLTRTPDGWTEDLLVCLGLTPTDIRTTAAAADRLVVGVLELLRTIDPTVDRQDGVAELVRSRDLDRLLDASRALRR